MVEKNELVQEPDTSKGIFWIALTWVVGGCVGLILVAGACVMAAISMVVGVYYLAHEIIQKARFQFAPIRFTMPN
jgi:hypothetical protein